MLGSFPKSFKLPIVLRKVFIPSPSMSHLGTQNYKPPLKCPAPGRAIAGIAALGPPH